MEQQLGKVMDQHMFSMSKTVEDATSCLAEFSNPVALPDGYTLGQIVTSNNEPHVVFAAKIPPASQISTTTESGTKQCNECQREIKGNGGWVIRRHYTQCHIRQIYKCPVCDATWKWDWTNCYDKHKPKHFKEIPSVPLPIIACYK